MLRDDGVRRPRRRFEAHADVIDVAAAGDWGQGPGAFGSGDIDEVDMSVSGA
ncbi:MAG TPA: hypothetical protein VHT92_12125 [Candidatus Cybelea sp.]|nr:hypothetical protein [Candidatus Cybelea sp.]